MGDQGTVPSALEACSQNTETAHPTTIVEWSELRDSVCIESNGGREGGNGPARKRRCRKDRMNSYDTGCVIDDAATPFSEGKHLDKAFGL